MIRDLKEYLENRCTYFRAGCITKFISNWQMITSDKEILTSVRGATIEFDTRPHNTKRPQSVFSVEESAIIDNEVAKLLSKNIIETTDHTPYEVISNIFIRPKKDGGHRLILNLKGLNQFVTYHHFKMETLQSIVRLVEKNCYMASLDLKDAYYTVSVNPSHRKYLRFIWKNVLYQFTCLPNGLSSCPRKFTKLLKPPLTELHKKGHVSSSYIDDLYLQGRTYDLCVSNVIDTFIQFDSLGFTIHPDKSVFIPSQRLVLLGFIIDSVAMTITLTPEKALKVKEACGTLMALGLPTIRQVACVIGKIISSFPGVMYGQLYYRTLEHTKTLALKTAKGDFDSQMILTEDCKKELQWWVDNIVSSHNVITHGQPSNTLTTDASQNGWGAVYNDTSTGGFWSDEEKSYHINYLELLAVFMGLQTFFKTHYNTHLRILTDNTTAIAVLNHMGTSHSDPCNRLGKEIWEWCIDRNIWLSAAHIPGVHNIKADLESRRTNDNTEWMLDRALLNNALSQLSLRPNIDLFASRLNNQFPQYVSFKPDPGAVAVDAFSLNLRHLKFYAFPPFSVINAFLQRVREDQASGILIMPNWPTQAWFPQAMQMCVEPPITLHPVKHLLQLPGKPEKLHPLHRTLTLLVCHLSGSNYKS